MKDFVVAKYAVDQCLANPNFRVVYFFPTVNQGKRAIFEGITLDNKPWLEELVHVNNLTLPKTSSKLYHSDNTIRFKNGSIIQILGADTAANKVGTNENLIIFSEAAHMPKFEVLLNKLGPSVNLIGGRIIAISTPNYGSYFNEFLQDETKTRWKTSIVKANEALDIDGSKIYSEENLALERANMSEEEFQQEYLCNLDIPNTTSIYGKAFESSVKTNDRDFKSGLHIGFDLGANKDYTVLTFARYTKEGNFTIVHHLGINGVGTKYHDNYIRQYCERNNIGISTVKLYLPFDAKNSQRGWDSNQTTYSQLKAAGWNINLVRKLSITEGIEITREAITNGKIHFLNDHNVNALIKKVKAYEYKKDTTGKNTWIPNHGKAGDSASNFADSLKYLAIGIFRKKPNYKNYVPIKKKHRSVFD